jgi:hypothetical protein
MNEQRATALKPVGAPAPIKQFAADDVFDRIQKALQDKEVVEQGEAQGSPCRGDSRRAQGSISNYKLTLLKALRGCKNHDERIEGKNVSRQRDASREEETSAPKRRIPSQDERNQ